MGRRRKALILLLVFCSMLVSLSEMGIVKADTAIMIQQSGDIKLIEPLGDYGNIESTDLIERDGDGIGDTSYVISDVDTDIYPLMAPIDVGVIPEFPSWTILSIFLVTTLIIVLAWKKIGG